MLTTLPRTRSGAPRSPMVRGSPVKIWTSISQFSTEPFRLGSMIDLRRLRVLRVLAEHGTVTAAAAALHLTPSAVSHQLRQLGRDLDVDLLSHEGRNVRLTPAARVLLEHADVLNAQWERAKADLAHS